MSREVTKTKMVREFMQGRILGFITPKIEELKKSNQDWILKEFLYKLRSLWKVNLKMYIFF